MRLLSLIAIKDQNAALAGQIQKANETTNALDSFKSAILEAIKALVAMANAELNKLQKEFGGGGGGGGGGLATLPGTPSSYVGGTYLGEDVYQSALGDIGLSNKLNQLDKGMTVNISVQGSVTTERDLVSAITQGIYNNQASGIPINYSTVY
jgi:hypothetical protein